MASSGAVLSVGKWLIMAMIPAGGRQPAQTPANVNDVLKLLRSDNRGLNLFLISFHFKAAGGTSSSTQRQH